VVCVGYSQGYVLPVALGDFIRTESFFQNRCLSQTGHNVPGNLGCKFVSTFIRVLDVL